MFLVLGGSISGEASLFRAAGLKFQVKQVPTEQAQPVHVTANNDGIWVSCPGASVLGQFLSAFGSQGMAPGEVSLDTLSGEPADAFKTMGLGGGGETLRIEDFMDSLKKSGRRCQVPSGPESRLTPRRTRPDFATSAA